MLSTRQVSEKLQNALRELDSSIDSFLESNWNITFLQSLESKWKKLQSSLQDDSSEEYFPDNQYALYARILEKARLKNPTVFKLQYSLERLVETPSPASNQITDYEMILACLLAITRDEVLREEIITLLDNVCSNPSWSVTKYYGDWLVLEMAFLAGNLDFFRFWIKGVQKGVFVLRQDLLVEAMDILPSSGHLELIRYSVEELEGMAASHPQLGHYCSDHFKWLIMSAYSEHWHVVDYLLSRTNFGKHALQQLLSIAALASLPERVMQILQLLDNRFDDLTILFKLANNSQWDMLKIIYPFYSKAKPCADDFILEEFLLDLQRGNSEEYSSGFPICLHPMAINIALIDAVNRRDIRTVHLLCSMTRENKPDKEAVSYAFALLNKASDLNLIKIFTALRGDNRLDATDLDAAFISARIDNITVLEAFYRKLYKELKLTDILSEMPKPKAEESDDIFSPKLHLSFHQRFFTRASNAPGLDESCRTSLNESPYFADEEDNADGVPDSAGGSPYWPDALESQPSGVCRIK